MLMLKFYDILFTLLHLLLVGFNLLGWIWRRTRKAHLVTVGVTFLCWFGLGIWYGWGYCPITDWQWQVKRRLGEKRLPASFIKYYADKLSGGDISPSLVNAVTLAAFLAVIAITIYINFLRKPRHVSNPGS
jgi:Protein of Unknown function (DUF2784)